jgi:hypothetical protein
LEDEQLSRAQLEILRGSIERSLGEARPVGKPLGRKGGKA